MARYFISVERVSSTPFSFGGLKEGGIYLLVNSNISVLSGLTSFPLPLHQFPTMYCRKHFALDRSKFVDVYLSLLVRSRQHMPPHHSFLISVFAVRHHSSGLNTPS
ncbi:unnamed protein product [Ceratitis capitata]|uniref:(Mediterranean fruit fly) hypothetical protein n=1 Tax=Ceratitis capitata TaxID=7213 RepID=A0A811UJ26_CERCA|nr:unnamed protein product [Ceratitis capitata]